MFYQFFFHCRLTSIETVRNIRDWEATSTFTHILSSVCLGSEESVFEFWFVFQWVGVQSGINKTQTHQFKHILRCLMKISVLFNILYVFTSSGKSLALSPFKNRDLLKLQQNIFCCFKKAAASHWESATKSHYIYRWLLMQQYECYRPKYRELFPFPSPPPPPPPPTFFLGRGEGGWPGGGGR